MQASTSTSRILMDKIILLLFIASNVIDAQSYPSTSEFTCPRQCSCDTKWKEIRCNKGDFYSLTEITASDNILLDISGSKWIFPFLKRVNFSSLTNLEYLSLTDCGIRSIDVDTFADLTKLRSLDLSNNRLTLIQGNAFRGLQLEDLYLMYNTEIQLIPDSFSGLSVNGLYLLGCSLRDLNPDVFLPIRSSLKRRLSLDKNELTSLNEGFEAVFSGLGLVMLDQNPFICDCNLAWLKDFVDSNVDVFKFGQPTCKSPLKLRGEKIKDLKSTDFSCQAKNWMI